MDEGLLRTIILFATKSSEEAKNYIDNQSKEIITALFVNLLGVYMNDKNSSTLREKITLALAGYSSTDRKLGYDGYKVAGNKKIPCEVKPQNIDTENNTKIKNPRKHNGGGNFTDYTFARFEKDKKENPNMLVSGFVDRKLLFIIEFPFAFEHFANKLERQLKKHFPSGDVEGRYLRSATFNFADYSACTNIKSVYLNEKALAEHKSEFTKKFYDFVFSLKKSV